MNEQVFAAGRGAVITGGAGGIGLATAKRLAGRGMHVAIADLDEARLDRAAAEIRSVAPAGGKVTTIRCDVSRRDEVERLKDTAFAALGDIAFLMNNAGTGPGGGPFDHYDRWQHVLGVNLWGVINGMHAFLPAMIARGAEAIVVNTGSKQGITSPPGDTAYNVSKAGVRAVTEGLQHALRNTKDCRITAHLLIPGWTHTGLTAAAGSEKPAGAWWPDEVVDYMFESLDRGDFYILCPDNDVSRETDAKRILWGAGDIAENRPPLSRWHPDYKDAFAKFLAAK